MRIDNSLHITFANGEGTINMLEFFPCSAREFKQLREVIDGDYRNCDKLYEQIENFFKESISRCDFQITENGKRYWKFADNVSEYNRLLESGKNPMTNNSLTKQQLKDYKKYRNEYQKRLSYVARHTNKLTKNKEWFEKHLRKGVSN